MCSRGPDSDPRLNHYSLECRHIFCGLCVAGWFASGHGAMCPVCRAACVAHPQRDFALRDILPLIYSGLGREAPTFESIDPIFTRIFAMIEESQAHSWWTVEELEAFWKPTLKEVQRMRWPNETEVEVDVEMEGEDESSVWEGGSGVDSEEGEGETGDAEGETGDGQGEGYDLV